MEIHVKKNFVPILCVSSSFQLKLNKAEWQAFRRAWDTFNTNDDVPAQLLRTNLMEKPSLVDGRFHRKLTARLNFLDHPVCRTDIRASRRRNPPSLPIAKY